MKLLVAAMAMVAVRAAADPLRLRADAFATTATPAGIISLAAEGEAGPNVAAEAVVWTGGAKVGDDVHGDVLVVALRARTSDGRASARVGRFVAMLGALRPVQVDGAAARLRLGYGVDIETVGGIPVSVGGRSWDWLVGGRIARRIGDMGSIGVAYIHQRDAGRLAFEEVGFDAGVAVSKRSDIGGKLAYDLSNPGVAEMALTASHRAKAWRADVYSSYRAASHLLPATSLFSVIGDVPSQRLGVTVTWQAAPRLAVIADAGVRRVNADYAPAIVARARLKLDDRGASTVSGELRRDGVGDPWTGARASARVAVGRWLYTSGELELVVRDRGNVWPWGLVAFGWDNGTWQAAVAGEALASPEYVHRVDVLAQLGRRWGGR